MDRAVILGGSGFIGRYLARALQTRGYEVIALDLRAPAEGVAWVRADARDPEAVCAAIRKNDIVVHLVHSSIPSESMTDPGAEFQENVRPYQALLPKLAAIPAGLIVYSSTGGQIYGNVAQTPIPESAACNPISAYGAAKLAMEQATRQLSANCGIPHLILRIGNPYGPYQELTNRHGVVPHLFRSVLYQRPFIVYGGGGAVRDYIYIEEAAEAAARLIEGQAPNQTVNIGTGIGTSLSDLIALIERVSGGKVEARNEPIRPSDVEQNVLDISLLKKLTGFTPRVGLEQGLSRTWEYMRSHEKA